MKKTQGGSSVFKRLFALLLAVALVAGYFPTTSGWQVSAAEPGAIDTVADPETLTRPTTIYGSNTLNAGKVTVGKSVATHEDTVRLGNNGQFAFTAEENNFTVTISQFAQVMGLTSETTVPVDVVFVLDTSQSMDTNRVNSMVSAANAAINTLMKANSSNRVGVVAFSSASGSGSSKIPAAQVLSALASYTGDAATNHLTKSGNNLVGRGNNAGSRHSSNGATNIQAGIVLGAQMLAKATDVTVNGVTRMPFLIVLSDGAPTYNFMDTNWYDPSMSATEAGSGMPYGTQYTGNSFMAALVGAYYKGVITEHYYGANASEENRCNIYTLGVDIDSSALAKLTMDPKTNYNANATGNNNAAQFTTYWKNYLAGNTFNVNCGSNQNLSLSATSIQYTQNYVSGISSAGKAMYSGDIRYNDGYFSATSTAEINQIFTQVVTEIQKKAISSPTQVSTEGANFSGYVHFADPIGEYMEVKDMKGIVLGDQLYSGASFAKLLKGYGANNATQKAFDQMLRDVLDQRMRMSGSNISAAQFVADALASSNQANYTDDNNFDNSIVWWGSDYVSGNSEQLQVLAHAGDDSVAYIEEQKAAGNIPAGAKYVCRSYFFYGNSAEEHEFMYFMLRVQRSLEAPYQQTVVISCPASLLSMEKVLITEEADGTYTAAVTEASPARVVYEVGLRSDINAQNVDQIVNDTYRNETVNGTGSVNYSNGTYNFFTNDWDRSQSNNSHHRAMTEASFEAAADNSFYTYQQDTQLVDVNGNPITGTVTAGDYYYVREYYDWAGKTPVNGSYTATKKTQLIKVEITDPSVLKQSGSNWYIPKGAYTASTLETTGDDIVKTSNDTKTSAIVSHAHRTGNINDNDYAVALGNNGMLTLVSDPPKSVSIGTNTTNDNGKTVMVGETLTYKVKVVNNEGTAATAVVTDVIPTGTQLVAGSISHGGSVGDDGKTITWNLNLDADPNRPTIVSFEVVVLPEALAGEQNVQNITNTATIQIGNNPSYKTNTVTNPPEGKKVVVDTTEGADGIQVGDTLTYRIRFYNDTNETATVTVRDIVPAGTTFVSADHGGRVETSGENAGKVVWTIENVAPGRSGVVSFIVEVDASAKVQSNDDGIIIRNDAQFRIGTNGPWQDTNTTETKVGSGDVLIKKLVTNTDKQTTAYRFKVVLSESTGMLNGTYSVTEGGASTTITFTNGESEITLWHDRAAQIHDLPEGVTIYVREIDLEPGWSASYEDNDGGYDPQRVIVDSDMLKTVTITNTYRVSPVTFQLKGTKNFTGSNFPAGNFTFNAKQVDLDNSGNVIDYSGTPAMASAVVTHAGGTTGVDFTFSPRTFTEEETRYYLIDEAAVVIPGVTSSTKQYLLRLQVVDINAQLTMFAAYKVRESAGDAWSVDAGTADGWTEFDWENASVQFTNTYVPRETSLTLSGTKELSGRFMTDNEFGFELVEIVNTTEVPVSTALVKADSTDAHNGAFTFETITYTTAGSHEYIIREIQGHNSQITYDDDYYYVKVTVTDHGVGQLEAAVTEIVKHEVNPNNTIDISPVSNEYKYSFENQFVPAGTSVSLSGNKILAGAEADGLAAGEFSFSVQEADKTGAVVDYNGDGVIEEYAGTNAAQNTPQGGVYTAAINFAQIHFTAQDMVMDSDDGAKDGIAKYYYVVKEKIPAEGAPGYDVNMGYEQTSYLVTVKLTYSNATGRLQAEIESIRNMTTDNAAEIVFTNYQNPAEIRFRPEAKKVVLANSNNLENLRFSFRVIATDSNELEGTGISAPTTLGGWSSLSGDPEFSYQNVTDVEFTWLILTSQEFEALDTDNDNSVTLSYTISEVTEHVANNGITYSTAQYQYQVTIVRNETTNALEIKDGSEVYYDGGTVLNALPSFVNKYKAEKNLNIYATKEFVNADNTNRPLDDDLFDFRLQLLNRTNASGAYQYTIGAGIVNGVNKGTDVTFGSLYFTDEQMTDAYLYSTSTDATTGVKTTVYQYDVLMSEIKPVSNAIPGVTYDENKYIVSIQWTKTEDGATTTHNDPVIVAAYLAEENSGIYTATETDNNLYDDADPDHTGVTFKNTYKPTTGDSVVIEANKTLEGRDLSAGEFTFNLYYLGANDETTLIGKTDVTGITPFSATNAQNGSFSFLRTYPATMDLNSFFGSGDTAELYYLLEEANGVLGGVTYSTDKFYVKVTLKHDAGKASIQVTGVTYYAKNEAGEYIALAGNYENDAYTGELPVFVNSYKSTTTHYTPVANKQLLGAINAQTGEREVLEQAANQYGFEIVELDHDNSFAELGVVSVGANAANGTVTFSPISYSHRVVDKNPHAHYYEIREVEGNLPGITCDETKYYMAVEIYDNQAGKLYVLNAKYYTSKNFTTEQPVYTEVFYTLENGAPKETTATEGTVVTFKNHYGPGYVDIQLDITKHMNLVGTEEYNLQDGQFDFEVLDANGNVVTVGTNQAGGQSAGVTFGTIIITSKQVKNATDGKFVYTIREIVPDDAAVTGITVEAGRTITATVTVVDDGYGNLTYTVAYTDNDETAGNEQKFTNTYTANPVNFNIVGHKHLTGKHLAADEFVYELYNQDPTTAGVSPYMTTTNNALGEVVFSMSYDRTGTYTYWMKESGTGSGAVNTGVYDMDETVYVITVVVADDLQGNLYVKDATKTKLVRTYSLRAGLTQITGMDFYNTFTPTPLTIDLTTDIGGTKSVIDAEGNNRDDLAEGFEFEVRDISNNLVSEGVSKKVGNQVIIDFSDFTFNTEGEYHYWIYEKNVQEPFVKDAAIYEIHILVHKNMETGELYINSSEIMTFAYNELAAHDATSNEDPVVFVNQYLPDPTTVTITANKELTGRDLNAGEFTFHLVEVIDGVDTHLIRSEVTNAANGKISFQLTYTTTGEHTYTIHEHAPADANKLPGVTYDERSYGTIKVTVVEQNGELVVTQGSSIASGVTITNKYEAAPVTAEVHAQKLLENKTLAKDDFTFQMKDEDGNVVATAKNDEDGKISFQIPYEHKDLAGQTSATFVYTISEVKGEIPGVIYDENSYKVYITVTDDLHGYLKYAVIYENGMAPTFTNVYETDDAAVTIKAEKKFEGNTLKGEDFTFQLKDAQGNVVATAKNDAEGKVRFDFLLEEAGEYTYTISELAGDDSHIIYDDKAYTVTVVVTDNGQGGLEHQVTYAGDKNEPPVFNNTYLPDATIVTLEATKKFTGGKTLKADAFEFQLLDKDGKVVATAKNTAEGKISFTVPVEEAGEYTYTMVEKAGTDAQITYDSAKHTVTVKVENNGAGELKSTVTYGTTDGNAPVFTNTYTPEKITVTLKGNKTLTGRDMKAGEFKFQVHDSTGTLVATGTNTAKGDITFTGVGIVTKGTYLLTVSEVKGKAEYVTYDTATFQVKITVENEDGVLVPTVTYLDGDIAFKNTYDVPGNPETGDNMPIYLVGGVLVISALAIVLLFVMRPKKGGKYAKK